MLQDGTVPVPHTAPALRAMDSITLFRSFHIFEGEQKWREDDYRHTRQGNFCGGPVIKKFKTLMPALPKERPDAGVLRISNFFHCLDMNSCSCLNRSKKF